MVPTCGQPHVSMPPPPPPPHVYTHTRTISKSDRKPLPLLVAHVIWPWDLLVTARGRTKLQTDPN